MPPQNLFRLKASIQEYKWGKPGSASLVAKYAPSAVGDDFKFDEKKTYAEIWMGTHQNGPAHLWKDPSTSLHSLVTSNPAHYLGATRASAHASSAHPHTAHVPFLFKILSIARALPLQAHPDRALARALHAADTQQFVDANHKPEIAVAVRDGFRPPPAAAAALARVPELRAAVGDDAAVLAFARAPGADALRRVFTRLLEREQADVRVCVERLVARIQADGASALDGAGDGLADVVLQLHTQYPGDVGVLAAPFFMNLITLDRGEAVYIGADEAHAYLEGDIIECMAVSDNVLNAAFVPPAERNTSTFTEALTYTARAPTHWALPRAPYTRSATGATQQFDPPLEEFTVLWTQLAARAEVLRAVAGPTIGIVTQGSVALGILEGPGAGETLRVAEGGVFFVAPENTLEIAPEHGDAEVWSSTCAA